MSSVIEKLFRFKVKDSPDWDAESFYYHERTAEEFNNAVARANMASHFNDAIRELALLSDVDLKIDENHEFDYVLPGHYPENEVDRMVYKCLYHAIKAREKKKNETLALLELLSNDSFERRSSKETSVLTSHE